jgi:hypothetical protein
MRQFKGSPEYELLPSKKDPRKLRWQRVEPKPKAPQRARRAQEKDEETQRYHKLIEILKGIGRKAKRLKGELQGAGVSKRDAERISFDYLIKEAVPFFVGEPSPQKPPTYPIYPKELQRKEPSRKPITPANPGYEVKVLGGSESEVAVARGFVDHLLGALREVHPLPKVPLKVIVAVPERYESVGELERLLSRYFANPANITGAYVLQDTLILLRGFKSFIHEFGHYLDDAFSQIAKRPTPSKQSEKLLSEYSKLKEALKEWFAAHEEEILGLAFKRWGLPLTERRNTPKERQIKAWLVVKLINEYEMFAYTYEQYVIWKFAEQGRTDLAEFWKQAAQRTYAPLFPAEMFKPVKDAYDRFFDAVRRFADDEDVLKWLHRLLWAKF